MKLQFENEADVPQESKDSFVEFKVDGNNVWMHKDLAEQKKEGFRTQGQLTNLKKDFDGFKTKIETEKEEAIRLAKEESSQKMQAEIEKLRKEGKTTELHALEIQEANDKNLSLETMNQELQSKLDEMHKSQVEQQNMGLAKDIASQYVPSELIPSFSKLLMDRIKNTDGKSFFTNTSGEAVDSDMSRIVEVLNNDPELKHYAKFPGSKGGYGGKGGSKDVTGKTISRAEFESKPSHEKSQLMKSGVKVTS